MPPLPPLPPKKDVLLALLERSSVFLHLDPRRDAVRVPDWFKKQPQLILQIGLNLAVPIRDLEVDDEAVSCTLSFSRTPHFCHLPWDAVYAIVGEDGRGMVWPDDVPREVAAQQQQVRRDGETKKKKRARPKLRAVGSDSAASPEPHPTDEDPASRDGAGSEPPPGAGSDDGARSVEASPDAAGTPTDRVPDGNSPGRTLPPYLRVVK